MDGNWRGLAIQFSSHISEQNHVEAGSTFVERVESEKNMIQRPEISRCSFQMQVSIKYTVIYL